MSQGFGYFKVRRRRYRCTELARLVIVCPDDHHFGFASRTWGPLPNNTHGTRADSLCMSSKHTRQGDTTKGNAQQSHISFTFDASRRCTVQVPGSCFSGRGSGGFGKLWLEQDFISKQVGTGGEGSQVVRPHTSVAANRDMQPERNTNFQMCPVSLSRINVSESVQPLPYPFLPTSPKSYL